jgi:tricorn protease
MYNVQNPGEGTNLTNSGFSDGSPLWAMDGKALLWVNDKEGKQPLAMSGAREVDIYAMFFEKNAYDRFLLNKDEFALLKEKEDKENKDKEKQKEADKAKETDPKKAKSTETKASTPPWIPDLKNVEDRRVRLTPGSVNLAGFRMSPKGDKLYFLARYEKDYDVWVIDTRTKELKSLAKLGANNGSMELSNDGKTLFVLANGKFKKLRPKAVKSLRYPLMQRWCSTRPENVSTSCIMRGDK